MAEGGNNNTEGQDAQDPQVESDPTGDAWLQKLEQIEQEMRDEKNVSRAIQSYTDTQRGYKVPQADWRTNDLARSGWKSRRTKQEATRQQNVLRRSWTPQTRAHPSDMTYVKGTDSVIGQLWGRFTTGIWRVLGLD